MSNMQQEDSVRQYRMPRSGAKKDTSILHSLEFGVSPELRDVLIEQFDITEADFRQVRTKKDEIIYYQITPQHVMLSLCEINEWPILSQCPQCSNIRYDDPRKENEHGERFYYITPAALEDIHDLNVTFEHFHRD